MTPPRDLNDSPRQGTREDRPNRLTLNVAPFRFSAERLQVGRTRFTDDDAYDRLRDAHRTTHAFRFDRETGDVVSVGLAADCVPVGAVSEELVSDHLLLLGKAVQRTLLRWLEPRYVVVRTSRPVTFWGRHDRSRLLSTALTDAQLTPMVGLDVLGRFDLDTRMLEASGDAAEPFLGLVIDADTANVLDLPVSTLLERGVDVTGLYVCRRGEADPDSPYAPTPGAGVIERLDTLGRVRIVDGAHLVLVDARDAERVSADAVMLEPKQENLERVVRALYPRQAVRVLARLKALREPFATAPGKLGVVRELLDGISGSVRFAFSGGVTARPQGLLAAGDALFPPAITTGRPTCLFGPQGRETDELPDRGIQRHGPYKYLQHERTAPTIAVICEARQQGRMEQFVADLRNGVSDEAWAAANAWRPNGPPPNPYRGGLIGKYRLQRVQVVIETVADVTPAAYRTAIDRLLGPLPATPDLALVQTREAFKTRFGDQNPYFVAKAAFMTAGVPVQAVQAETFDGRAHQIPFRLNNLSLQTYAKLDGVPWVISTRQPTSHELVVGLGYTEVGEGRFGARTRYVGITTLFQGDGRYLLWGRTREVEFSQYAEALLESLRAAVGHARSENNWQPGDRVRLVFHVYKPLKHTEIDAIRALVKELVAEQHPVSFAFLDVSHYHDFRLFDPNQAGIQYTAPGAGQGTKGAGVPARGLCVQLGARTALLQLTGPSDLKTEAQGVPRCLKLDLHAASDFDDLAYLVRQVYHFSYLSWRSFFPGREPVTIGYSRRIATLLGNLRPVTGWDSRVLTLGSLRTRHWFL